MFDFSFWKNCEEDKEDTGAISLDNLGGVFILIFAGIFLALIILAFEFYYYKKKDHSVVKVLELYEDVKKDYWLIWFNQTLWAEMTKGGVQIKQTLRKLLWAAQITYYETDLKLNSKLWSVLEHSFSQWNCLFLYILLTC